MNCPECNYIWERLTQEQRRKLNELGRRCAAKLLLLDCRKTIVVPTKEEWIGFNLLERDDQL